MGDNRLHPVHVLVGARKEASTAWSAHAGRAVGLGECQTVGCKTLEAGHGGGEARRPVHSGDAGLIREDEREVGLVKEV